MIVRPENFSVRPLFYDALSAEFLPKSDPLKRAHTLGRLTIASVMKGEASLTNGFNNRTINDTFPVFTYTPSWAPNVTSKVDGEWTSPGIAIMHGILLEYDRINSIYIADEVDSDGVQQLYLGTEEDDTRYTLNLGDDLNSARTAVAAALEQFFNK